RVPFLPSVIVVLNLVEVLDQQIATPRGIAEQRPDLFARFPVYGPALGRRAVPPALATAPGNAFLRRRGSDRTTHRRRRSAQISPYSLGLIVDPIIRSAALACRRASTTIDRVMYVEFLGVPRHRAGVAEMVVEARTL